ncbi:MAG: outer membrane lipoprotein carrier protein LolA [Phycisphaerae bacterium]
MRPTNIFAVAVAIHFLFSTASAAWAQGMQEADPSAAPLDPRVDEILARLEARKVKDLEAKLTWEVHHVMDEPDQSDIRQGKIWYKDREPIAVFLVDFDKKINGRRVTNVDEKHMFDGQWYVTLREEQKIVERRQVRAPNDTRDPYRLGEGPFPVPFGQTRADILREFTVSLAPSGDDDPKNTDHLVLVPKPRTPMADDYEKMHFWIQRSGDEAGLPVKVKLDKFGGLGRVEQIITVTFDRPKLDRGFSDKIFVVKSPPGWEEVVEYQKP